MIGHDTVFLRQTNRQDFPVVGYPKNPIWVQNPHLLPCAAIHAHLAWFCFFSCRFYVDSIFHLLQYYNVAKQDIFEVLKLFGFMENVFLFLFSFSHFSRIHDLIKTSSEVSSVLKGVKIILGTKIGFYKFHNFVWHRPEKILKLVPMTFFKSISKDCQYNPTDFSLQFFI